MSVHSLHGEICDYREVASSGWHILKQNPPRIVSVQDPVHTPTPYPVQTWRVGSKFYMTNELSKNYMEITLETNTMYGLL